MKRAADSRARSAGDDDAAPPDQRVPENPAVESELKDPPGKKARQQSDQSTLEGSVSEAPTAMLSQIDEEGKGALEGERPRQDGSSSVQGVDEPEQEESKVDASGEAASRMGITEFPAQLMNLLQRNVAPDAIWFLEAGEAIGLHRDRIVDKVLNEHFRGMKFNSLVRNLNRWGFRRISHPSLRDKERGYHHLLFQRDKPELVYRMKRDSNAKEVVRQLDLADGGTDATAEEKPTGQEAKAKTVRASEGLSEPRAANATATSSQQLASLSSSEAQRSLAPHQQTLLQGGFSAQRQQLLLQGLAAQQQLEWQRQQMAMGSMHPAAWGGFSSWNIPSHTLPAPSAIALGLQQQQQQQRLQASAQYPALRSSVGRSHMDPPSQQPMAGDAERTPSQDDRRAQDEGTDRDEEDDEAYPRSSSFQED